MSFEGWHGWDDYAPFYDWENKQTLGRRDVPFWRRVAAPVEGPVLELGCGTGRVTLPLARAGVTMIGMDRSEQMLARARTRIRRGRLGSHAQLVRGDIRHLPFPDAVFPLILAPYGILQSLLKESDLARTLAAVERVLQSGGLLGLELAADLPSWKEYRRKVSMRGRLGRRGLALTLVESVRQDPARRLTFFDQEFVQRQGRKTQSKTFTLAFRTLSVPQMARRLEKAGLEVSAMLGDYRGGPWDPRAEVWILLAKKP